MVTNAKEAAPYIGRLRNTQAKIDWMIGRCERAIDEKFYKKVENGEFFEKKRRTNGTNNI